jgi:hypothetical protein
VSEEREELSQHIALSALVRLAQERNTLLLEAVGELRHIHRGVDALVDALPQPLGQLKSLSLIFGIPT